MEVDILAVDIRRDVSDIAHIFIIYVVEARAAIHGDVVIDLIRHTELQSEVVLLTLDVAAHTVGWCLRCQSLTVEDCRNERYLPLETWQSVVEDSLSSTAGERESGLKGPLVVDHRSLERRQYGHRRLTTEALLTVVVATIEFERLIERCALERRHGYRRGDITGLIYVLHVEREVESLRQE